MLLEDLIERYGKNKTIVNSYKKDIDEDNEEIKRLIVDQGVPVEGKDGSFKAYSKHYTATYSVSKTEDFDEDKLILKLKDLINKSDIESLPAIKKCIVYKPTVDMEALENAIYLGTISASELSDCRVSKETARLVVKKIENRDGE